MNDRSVALLARGQMVRIYVNGESVPMAPGDRPRGFVDCGTAAEDIVQGRPEPPASAMLTSESEGDVSLSSGGNTLRFFRKDERIELTAGRGADAVTLVVDPRDGVTFRRE